MVNRGGIPRIQTYRGPRTHPLCRGTRAHPGYVGLAEAVPTNPPRRNVLRSAPLMITNPTIELAAGIKVVHEMPLVVQCGIVRIIVADSLRWKMLPTFVPGHTHCRGQHSILITPRATRKGYGKQTFRQICCYKGARSMTPSGNTDPDARVKIAPPNPRRALRDAESPRFAASVT